MGGKMTVDLIQVQHNFVVRLFFFKTKNAVKSGLVPYWKVQCTLHMAIYIGFSTWKSGGVQTLFRVSFSCFFRAC